MKKIISLFLALFLMLSVSITAFAQEKTRTYEEVLEKSKATANYVCDGVSAFTVDSAIDFWNLTDSGKDMSKYNDGFFASVKDNLDANSGKIIIYGSESIPAYAAVISLCYFNDFDPSNFYGYDLVSALLSMDPTVPFDNPYFYRTAIELIYLNVENGEEFAKKLCDAFVDNYYTLGSGMSYWGYSCDNTSSFIAALAPFYNDYKSVVDDAVNLIQGYKQENGYCSNPDDTLYGGDQINADSTGLALLAYSSLFNFTGDLTYSEKATEAYYLLLNFEQEGTPGVFTYAGSPSVYAAKDALLGLNAYQVVALFNSIDDDNDDKKEETVTEQETNSVTKEEKSSSSDYKKSPNTGADTEIGAVCLALMLSGITVFAYRKHWQ